MGGRGGGCHGRDSPITHLGQLSESQRHHWIDGIQAGIPVLVGLSCESGQDMLPSFAKPPPPPLDQNGEREKLGRPALRVRGCLTSLYWGPDIPMCGARGMELAPKPYPSLSQTCDRVPYRAKGGTVPMGFSCGSGDGRLASCNPKRPYKRGTGSEAGGHVVVEAKGVGACRCCCFGRRQEGKGQGARRPHLPGPLGGRQPPDLSFPAPPPPEL